MVFTLGIMTIEFSFIALLAIGITYGILKLTKNNSKKTTKYSIITICCIVLLSFVLTYSSYFNYITKLDFSRVSQGVNQDSYWKKNLGGDMIGSLFVLKLIPSKSKQMKSVPKSNNLHNQKNTPDLKAVR